MKKDIQVERVTYQEGNNWITEILVDRELLHKVVTGNKISSASKAGKWIKDNKALIDAKIKELKEKETNRKKSNK